MNEFIEIRETSDPNVLLAGTAKQMPDLINKAESKSLNIKKPSASVSYKDPCFIKDFRDSSILQCDWDFTELPDLRKPLEKEIK